MSRTATLNIVLTAIGLLLWVAHTAGAWERVLAAPGGRDFGSYYVAAHAARMGLDPYDGAALQMAGEQVGRPAVHPYFYPPPFLLAVGWTTWLPLPSAYRAWAALDILAGALAMAMLAAWWRPLHPLVPALVALLLGLVTAIPNNTVMGQANHLVLAFVVAGLWADARDRQGLAGVLVGLGCMAKMSPALFVLWWVLRGRWWAAGVSVATAVVTSLLVLPLVPLDVQVRFYTHVLPQFASGDYNGLSIPIGLFGNHSVPNVLDQVFPGRGGALSALARASSQAFSLGALLALGALFRRGPSDGFRWAAQVAAIAVLMLLVPVYTYEHHLVWALPAMLLAAVGILDGRAPRLLVPVLVLAIAILAFDLQTLKAWSHRLGRAGIVLQEAKFAALLVLGAAAAWWGRQDLFES
ncbi:MAG: DUF2029 domain-containing protein [Alphaproteobacteria bacterium]|nr:DUF2029 domain-containing protein [Alphaproteobacteria bacterium]